jgi:hypothetical protein
MRQGCVCDLSTSLRSFGQTLRNVLPPAPVLNPHMRAQTMSWLAAVLLVILAGVAGFVGLAIVSTAVGQYAIAGVVCAIATYWLTLAANDTHRPVH